MVKPWPLPVVTIVTIARKTARCGFGTSRQESSGGAFPTGYQDVQQVAFSPDGKTLAIAGTYHVVLWDLVKEKKQCRLEDMAERAVAFSPDEELIASGGCFWRIWRVDQPQKPRLLTRGSGCSDHALAFSPDGKLLATVNDHGDLFLWDVVTGKSKVHVKGDDFGRRPSLAFSFDGKMLVFGRGNIVQIWEVALLLKRGN
jgi:WD40 repeat protein